MTYVLDKQQAGRAPALEPTGAGGSPPRSAACRASAALAAGCR